MRALIYLRDQRQSSPSLLWSRLRRLNFFLAATLEWQPTSRRYVASKSANWRETVRDLASFQGSRWHQGVWKCGCRDWGENLKQVEAMLRGVSDGVWAVVGVLPHKSIRSQEGWLRQESKCNNEIVKWSTRSLWTPDKGLTKSWDRRTIRSSLWGWNATKTA